MEDGAMERRHSTDSNDSSNCSKQRKERSPWSRTKLWGDEGSGGTGRVLKPTTPKAPANALQFVKTGPCDLYKKAQEQIKKAELIKKEKQTMRSDTEEWQSNLDNWKSSRRKMQEHIIERVVEVKKFELEEHERSRRRSKTFSEMMQERGRKTSIPVYDDNSANDFSDLGLSSSGDKMTNGNSSLDDSSSDNDFQVSKCDTIQLTNGIAFSSKSTECSEIKFAEVTTLEEKKDMISEKEEYTYERAIQNYVNFAETRVKSLSARSIPEEVKAIGNSSPPKEPPPIPEKPRRSSVAKVDSVFSKAELYRKSVSTTDLTESNKKVALPKVNISKRRELFEKFVPEVKSPVVTRSTVDLNSSKSIKERLSFLEKNGDVNKNKSLDRPSPEVSVKDRLTNIENFKQQDNSNGKTVKSAEITSTSIRDRLNNLEKSKVTTSKTSSSIEPPTSIKDRLSSLQSACNKEVSKSVVTKPNNDFHEKLNTFQEIEASTEEVYPLSEDTGYGYSSEDLFEAKKSRHYRHRSLDSLDVDDSPVSNETFERVQSYEDLDYCRNYPASSISGDTDREDSGIHTADVSSSVSQADDFDLHLDSNLSDDIKIAHQNPVTTAVEELKMNGSKSPTELSENVSCLRFEVPESSPTPRVYSKLDCSSPLPAILENPAEFNSPVDMPVVNTYSPFNSLTHSSQGDADDKHFPSYQPADLNFSSHLNEPDIPKPEPRTSLPSDCDITVIEACQTSSTPTAHPSLSSNNAHSSNDSKNFNGFDGKDVSNSSDVTLVEIEEINDTEVIEKDLLLEEEASRVQSFPELLDQSDIVSTTNQIIALHSRDQSSEDLTPVLPPKAKDIPPSLPIPIKNDCLVLDMTMVSDSGSVFPLSPTALEPPKEKPPPPPIENSDDDLDDVKAGLMKRMDSAKRIKKEIRLKRSSFLGLDGADDNYVDPETELTRPPDLTALLTEERRLERQLYRQSLCSETDSNQESRDSGVELDNKPSDPWVSHSRNNSDNFGNQSTTSEEEDIMKKEREIIETLEQEEKLRKQHLGEKLAMRLREFDVVEKDSAEWQRIYGGVEINHMVLKSDDQLEMIQVDSKETFNNVEKVNGEGMWYDHSSDTESVREPSYPYSPSPPVPPHRGQPSLPQTGDRHYDLRNAFNLADRQAYQPQHERQMFQPPQVDRQLHFPPPQERQPAFQPPQERQPAFPSPQERQPAFQPPQERQPVFQPPQERQPAFPSPQDRQPAFQPPQERQPVFQPPQERQPAFPSPQERQPAFQPPQERQTFQTAERQSFQPSERQTFQQSEHQGFQGEDICGYQSTGPRHGFSNSQFQSGVIGQAPLPPPPERQPYQPPVEKQKFDQAVHFQPPVQSRIYPGSVNHDNTHNHGHRPGAYTLPYRSSYSDLLEVQSGESKDLHRRSMPELQALTRRSMPDLQQATTRQVPPDHRRPPPPALPAKPNHLAVSAAIAPQPMTRTTKQALSAAPRSKLISNESWQVKRKPKQENCNYQHWLIQEAEHRRITEQQKRQSSGGMQAPPPPPPSAQAVQPQTQRSVGPQLQQQVRPGHKPVYTSTPAPPQWTSHSKREKPLPDSIIQTLTQRMHNRKPDPNNNRRSATRYDNLHYNQNEIHQEKVLSVSGKKRCSACGEELGRGAAMIIESLQLFYHIDCFKCCVCCMQLGDGLMGTDVRVRNNKLHCHNCYSSDDGAKFSCV